MATASNPRLRPRPPPDPTVLRPSITCSITGLKQAVACLENGTPEIRDYLLHECSLIYECKTCYSLFRSVANFVAHKRSYCDSPVKNVYHIHDEPQDKDRNQSSSYSTVAYVEPEAIDTIVPEPQWDIQDYSPSLSLLKEAGFIEEIHRTPLVKKLKPDLNTVIHRLKKKAEYTSCMKNPVEVRVPKQNLVLKEPVLRLERLSQTTCAMFQTLSEKKSMDKTTGQKYMEVEKLRQRPSVMAGPDGKIIHPDKKSKPKLLVEKQRTNESLKENLTSKRRYNCVFCNDTYSKVITVIRHIQKVHGKIPEQAQNYRSAILKTSHLTGTPKAVELSRKKSQLSNKLKKVASGDKYPNRPKVLPNTQFSNSKTRPLAHVICKSQQPSYCESKKGVSSGGYCRKKSLSPIRRSPRVSTKCPSLRRSSSKAMECKHCQRSFVSIFEWRKHQRKCKSNNNRSLSETSESVVDILKNQPVIVLNKLDCSNLLYRNSSDKPSEKPQKSFSLDKLSAASLSTLSKIKPSSANNIRYVIPV